MEKTHNAQTVANIASAMKAVKNGAKPMKLVADQGLRLRIEAGGESAAWWVRFSVNKKEREYRLPEPYADKERPGCFTLKQARERAQEIRSDALRGIDPAIAEQDKRRAEQRQREEEDAERRRQANRMTVAQLFDKWDAAVLVERKSAQEVRRGWNLDVLPALGASYVDEVHRRDIMAVLDKVVARGANRLANRLLGEIRQVFRYAITRGIIENDPTSVLNKSHVGGKETERDRVLSEQEIRLLRDLMPCANLKRTTEHAIWLMLATGCRIGELVAAERKNIDLDAGTWFLPITKNTDPHTIYLSEFANKHMSALLDLACAEFTDPQHESHRKPRVNRSSTLLMPSSETRPIDPKSITKQIGDRQLAHAERKAHASRTKAAHSLELTGGRWTPHDLRRTAATIMGELGVAPHVIDRCLNHREQNRITRTYQRQEMRQEQAEAWRLLGERLDLLTHSDADNVLTLPLRAA